MVEQAVAHQATMDDLVAWASAPQQWRIIERAERIIETENFGYWREYKDDKEAARQAMLERLERKIEAHEFGLWEAKFLLMDLSARVERHLR